jgi:hypothetical protein
LAIVLRRGVLNNYHTITPTGKWNNAADPLRNIGLFYKFISADKEERREMAKKNAFPPSCLPAAQAKKHLRKLFFVSFTIAGRAYLIGSALHIVGFFLGSAPFRV